MPSTEYTLRQRVALVLEASVTAETLVAMPDADIHHAFLMEQRISPTLLRAAQVTPLQLKAHGTRTTADLAALGFTTLHLLDEEWREDAIAAYGAPALLDEFLATSNDAVVLAGSEAVERAGHQPGPAAPALRQPAGRRARGACAVPARAPRAARDAARDGAARRTTSQRSGSPRTGCARTPSPRTRSCRCWAFR